MDAKLSLAQYKRELTIRSKELQKIKTLVPKSDIYTRYPESSPLVLKLVKPVKRNLQFVDQSLQSVDLAKSIALSKLFVGSIQNSVDRIVEPVDQS